MTRRPTILVALGCFTPAMAASGPNSSLVEAVAALSDRFRFRIVSLADRDETTGRWNMLDGCERISIADGPRIWTDLLRIVRDTPHELVVANGLFDRKLTLPLLLSHRRGALRSPLLLAPRGEFSPGALEIRSRRKRAFLALLRSGGFLRSLALQATDADEAAAIRALLPGARILIGPNIRRLVPLPAFRGASTGEPLRLAFASRIDRKKNLDWGLRLLAKARHPLCLDIYGPISDPAYWRECEAIIGTMPGHVEVRHCGTSRRDEMVGLLAGYDLFFLPTRGENFGHAIADALLAGTPVLLADTTPWRDLREACAGADLPLDDQPAWLAFLDRFNTMTASERTTWRHAARAMAERRLQPAADRDRLADCFAAAMGPSSEASADVRD